METQYIRCPCCDETIKVGVTTNTILRVTSPTSISRLLTGIGLTIEQVREDYIESARTYGAGESITVPHKITAIKKLRNDHDLGLKEAKDLIEEAMEVLGNG